MAEKLDLHLFKFTRSEGEVSRGNFVSKTLANLPNAKGYTYSATIQNILEIDKNPLRGFWT